MYFRKLIVYQTDISIDASVRKFLVAEVDDEKTILTFYLVMEKQWSDPQIKANFSNQDEEKDIRNRSKEWKSTRKSTCRFYEIRIEWK